MNDRPPTNLHSSRRSKSSTLRNLATWDRALRALPSLSLLTCAFLAPLPAAVRLPAELLAAANLAFTAVRGTCYGYALTGMSTCPRSIDPSATARRTAPAGER